MVRIPWTPGLTTLHRVLTAVLLAFVPPDAGIAVQAAYWLLLLLHASGLWSPWPLIVAWIGIHAMDRLGWLDLQSFALTLFGIAWCAATLGRWRPAVLEILLIVFAASAWRASAFDFSLETGSSYVAQNTLYAWLPLVFFARVRWIAWTGLLINGVVLLLLGAELTSEIWILHALAFSPAWIPRNRNGLPLTVYYDGECGFCHRSVRFLLNEDPNGEALRYAPLQGTSFAAAVPESERARLPDSIVVCDADGTILTRSTAALRLGAALGGYWRPLSALGWLIPRPLRDAAYDWIAARRKRWFAKPDGHCPLLSAEQRARFDP